MPIQSFGLFPRTYDLRLASFSVCFWSLSVLSSEAQAPPGSCLSCSLLLTPTRATQNVLGTSSNMQHQCGADIKFYFRREHTGARMGRGQCHVPAHGGSRPPWLLGTPVLRRVCSAPLQTQHARLLEPGPAGCVGGGLTPHQAFVCLGKEACLCYAGRLVREADEREFRLQRHQQSLHWQMGGIQGNTKETESILPNKMQTISKV